MCALERLSRREPVLADRDVDPVPRSPSPRQLVDTLVLGVGEQMLLAKRSPRIDQTEVGVHQISKHTAVLL